MSILNLNLENLEMLQTEKIHNHFSKTQNVLVVSKRGKIDFSEVDQLIDKSELKSSIYGIYVRPINQEKWVLKYIGTRKPDFIKARIKQHLIHPPNGTTSRIENVTTELNRGSEIGIKLASVYPDNLRLYYEAEILTKNEKPEWNYKKTPKK